MYIFILKRSKRKFESKSGSALIGISVFSLYGLGDRFVLSSLEALEQSSKLALFVFVDIEPNPVRKFFIDKLGKCQKIIDIIIFFIGTIGTLDIKSAFVVDTCLAFTAEYFYNCSIPCICHY